MDEQGFTLGLVALVALAAIFGLVFFNDSPERVMVPTESVQSSNDAHEGGNVHGEALRMRNDVPYRNDVTYTTRWLDNDDPDDGVDNECIGTLPRDPCRRGNAVNYSYKCSGDCGGGKLLSGYACTGDLGVKCKRTNETVSVQGSLRLNERDWFPRVDAGVEVLAFNGTGTVNGTRTVTYEVTAIKPNTTEIVSVSRGEDEYVGDVQLTQLRDYRNMTYFRLATNSVSECGDYSVKYTCLYEFR